MMVKILRCRLHHKCTRKVVLAILLNHLLLCSYLPYTSSSSSSSSSSLSSSVIETMSSKINHGKKILVVATRLHLDQTSSSNNNNKLPPDLETKMAAFYSFCRDSCQAAIGLVVVDITPGPALKDAVQAACDKVLALNNNNNNNNNNKSSSSTTTTLHVLPVTPWGRFTPALNAAITYACQHQQQKPDCDSIVFCSAETTASRSSMQQLQQHMTPDTLVVGAVLPGHDYQHVNNDDNNSNNNGQPVPLNGRTCPWNTLAIWNLNKLALTGFQLVSEGLVVPDDDKDKHKSYNDTNTPPNMGGVEEVVAIALLQKLLSEKQARAKLVLLSAKDDVQWNVQDFQNDPQRQKWHNIKMKSKMERPARQLQLFGTSLQGGIVYHC